MKRAGNLSQLAPESRACSRPSPRELRRVQSTHRRAIRCPKADGSSPKGRSRIRARDHADADAIACAAGRTGACHAAALAAAPRAAGEHRCAAPRGNPRRAADPGTAAGHPDRARDRGSRRSGLRRGTARPVVRPAVPDSTGLVPNRPSVSAAPRPPGEVTRQMGELLEFIQDPEAEINVVVGRSKLIADAPASDPHRDRQPGGRRHRVPRRSARSPRVQPLRPVVRHHEPDALGRERPAALVPGPGDARHPRRRVAAQADLPRRRRARPPGRDASHPGRPGPRLQDDVRGPATGHGGSARQRQPRDGRLVGQFGHGGAGRWAERRHERRTARRDGDRGTGRGDGAPGDRARGWAPGDRRREARPVVPARPARSKGSRSSIGSSCPDLARSCSRSRSPS